MTATCRRCEAGDHRNHAPHLGGICVGCACEERPEREQPKPTPRSWPEGTIPTPEQLAAWLKACTDEERLEVATVALRDGAIAARCFLMDHEGRLTQLPLTPNEVEQLKDDWRSGKQCRICSRLGHTSDEHPAWWAISSGLPDPEEQTLGGEPCC